MNKHGDMDQCGCGDCERVSMSQHTLCQCGAEATVTLTRGRKICQSCYSLYESDLYDAQTLASQRAIEGEEPA